MTREQQIAETARDIRVWARVVALRRLAQETAVAFERADAALRKELRALIDEAR